MAHEAIPVPVGRHSLRLGLVGGEPARGLGAKPLLDVQADLDAPPVAGEGKLELAEATRGRRQLPIGVIPGISHHIVVRGSSWFQARAATLPKCVLKPSLACTALHTSSGESYEVQGIFRRLARYRRGSRRTIAARAPRSRGLRASGDPSGPVRAPRAAGSQPWPGCAYAETADEMLGRSPAGGAFVPTSETRSPS